MESIEEGDFVGWDNGSGYVKKRLENGMLEIHRNGSSVTVEEDRCALIAKQYRLPA